MPLDLRSVDVSRTIAPPPRDVFWRLTLREFAIFGGFRGVQAEAEKRRMIALVILDYPPDQIGRPGWPRFRRPGSPFDRIVALYVGNYHPADRELVVDWFCKPIDYTSRDITRRYGFSFPMVDSVIDDERAVPR